MIKPAAFAIVLPLTLAAGNTPVSAGPHHGGHGFHSHHGHSNFGFYLSLPLFAGPYYAPYYPYYRPYYPPITVPVPVEPPAYIERSPSQPPPAPQLPAGYWYYCYDPAGYYPYVSECPSGWRQVAPQPQSLR